MARFENSKERYGLVAQVMHAAVAVLFIAAFATVYFRQWFTEPESALGFAVLHLHLSTGLSILVLGGLRVWWRLRSRTQPDELPGAWWEHLSARLVHVLLYALIILMPLAGYLGTGVPTDFFGLFIIPKFADTAAFDLIVANGLGLTFEEWEVPVDWLHKTLGELLVLSLVGLHVAAALFHHFIRRDGALNRMFVFPEVQDLADASSGRAQVSPIEAAISPAPKD